MTEAPNQTQIEPSARAVKVLTDYHILEPMAKAFLRAAYAIDLAPIIAESDRIKAENEKLLEEGSKMACGQCIVDGALIGDESGNLYCTVLAERDKTKTKSNVLSELYKHTIMRYRERLDELAKATAARNRMKAALEAILDYCSKKPDAAARNTRKSDLKVARAALEGKP